MSSQSTMISKQDYVYDCSDGVFSPELQNGMKKTVHEKLYLKFGDTKLYE